jgi:hypothetical protein
MTDFYDAPGLYDISRHIESGARGILARADAVAAIAKLDDFIDLNTLALKPLFQDVGSAREGQGSTYGRNITVAESRIEQSNVAVRKRITDVARTLTLQFAEFTKDKLAMLEDGSITTIAAAAHRSPQWRVDGGTITSLTPWRVILLGTHPGGEGHDITDESGDKRGELLAVVLQHATMSADNAQYELQRGQLANVPLSFDGLPEPTIADASKNVVSWIGENGPATILAV